MTRDSYGSEECDHSSDLTTPCETQISAPPAGDTDALAPPSDITRHCHKGLSFTLSTTISRSSSSSSTSFT